MSKAWHEAGNYRTFQRVKARILLANLLENEGRCTLAIEGTCTGQAETAHHVTSRTEVGDDPSYMVASCQACNQKINNPGRRSPPSKQVSNW
jgi:hypothetical protein